MNTIRLEFDMPEEILRYINHADKEYRRKAKELLLYQLISEDKISFGKAAELIGISKLQYIGDLSKMGIPYFESDIEEVMKDVETLTEYIKEN